MSTSKSNYDIGHHSATYSIYFYIPDAIWSPWSDLISLVTSEFPFLILSEIEVTIFRIFIKNFVLLHVSVASKKSKLETIW